MPWAKAMKHMSRMVSAPVHCCSVSAASACGDGSCFKLACMMSNICYMCAVLANGIITPTYMRQTEDHLWDPHAMETA
jgi:hypothetical protein